MRRFGSSAAVLTATMAWIGSAGMAPAEARTDVPVRQTVLPDGNIRYSVPITVGTGGPIEAELDTGSFGLRVLAAALKPDDYQATDMRRDYAFGGGAKFDGFLARATVGVGPSRTEGPILFHVIDRVSCVDDKPNCYAGRVKPEDYGIGGDGSAGQGFKAILGISMRRAATDDSASNPLTAMGGSSWILTLPRPGDADPGHLVLDPDDSDRAGFTTLKLKSESELSSHLAGWADAALPGCLVKDDGKTNCGATVIDSGAPGFSIGTAEVSQPRPLGPGHKTTLEIGGPEGPVRVTFTSGQDGWASRVFLHPPHGSGAVQLSAGTLPFFSYDVLYDTRDGLMGFRRRAP